METSEALRKRCSLKAHLSGREVEAEKINKVLSAGCLAPSARNMQPWRFIVVQGEKAVDSLVKAAFIEQNMVVKQAPVIIVVCARPGDDIIRDGKEYYLFDVGLAVENILISATDLGLATHLMTGINETEIKRILNIPGDVRVVAVTPLAYPLEASYDEAAKDKLNERTRKDLKEVAYIGKWGELEPT